MCGQQKNSHGKSKEKTLDLYKNSEGFLHIRATSFLKSNNIQEQ